MKKIYIGTSGWHYAHWSGPFYPVELPKEGFLGYYARRFDTVEVNSSFYGLPDEGTVRAWRDAVPEGFIFSVKASRLITHNKNLKDPETTLPLFLERVGLLGNKLGPVLFQLPPRWNLNLERLGRFLGALPGGLRCAFEFRNHTWHDPDVYSLLEKHNSAFCIYDLDRALSPVEVTADFVYLRLHGPDGPYRGRYTDAALKGWAKKLSLWAGQGRDVYCYFDNDEAGYAPADALRLKGFLSR